MPWSTQWQPTPVFLPWESHGLRSLTGCSLWGCKELDTTEWLGKRKWWWRKWRTNSASEQRNPGNARGVKQQLWTVVWRDSVDNWVISWGFPGGSGVKNLPVNAGDLGSIPGSGRSPGEGNHNPLHYSCLEDPMDRRAWRVTVYEVTKESDRTQWLNKEDNNRVISWETGWIMMSLAQKKRKGQEREERSKSKSRSTQGGPVIW